VIHTGCAADVDQFGDLGELPPTASTRGALISIFNPPTGSIIHRRGKHLSLAGEEWRHR